MNMSFGNRGLVEDEEKKKKRIDMIDCVRKQFL